MPSGTVSTSAQHARGSPSLGSPADPSLMKRVASISFVQRQLPQDDQAPAIAKMLDRLGEGAVVALVAHEAIVPPEPKKGSSSFKLPPAEGVPA